MSCLVTKVHRSIKGKLCTSFTHHTSLCLLQYCSKGIIYEHATIKQFHVDKTFIMNSVEEDCWWLAMVKVNQTSHLISAGRSLVWGRQWSFIGPDKKTTYSYFSFFIMNFISFIYQACVNVELIQPRLWMRGLSFTFFVK